MSRNLIFVVLICLLCVLTIFAGCDVLDVPDDPVVTPPDSNADRPVGGKEDRILGLYIFKTFEEYNEFYKIFINYNTERYFVPHGADGEFKFEYKFVSEGVEYSEFYEKKYAIDYPNQLMYVDIISNEDSGYCVQGLCFAFTDEFEPTAVTYNITENDGKFHLDNGGLLLNVYGDGSLIFVGRISKSANSDTIDTISKKLVNYFITAE